MILASVRGCLELRRVMTEVKSELPDFDPRTMLDFGSGPGTSALAVWDVWGAGGGSSVAQDGEETGEGDKVDFNSALFVHWTAAMRVPYTFVGRLPRLQRVGERGSTCRVGCMVGLGCTCAVLSVLQGA